MLTFYLSLYQRYSALWWWWLDVHSFFIMILPLSTMKESKRWSLCVWPLRLLTLPSTPTKEQTNLGDNEADCDDSNDAYEGNGDSHSCFFSQSWHIYLSAPSILSSSECLAVYMLGSAWPYVCLCAAQINTHKQKVTVSSHIQEKNVHILLFFLFIFVVSWNLFMPLWCDKTCYFLLQSSCKVLKSLHIKVQCCHRVKRVHGGHSVGGAFVFT